MDPHNDFDKHDRPPYDIAPATNTAYAAMRQQRDDLLAALKALTQDSRFNLVIGGDPNAVDALVKQVDVAIAKSEGR
jgi:hypothetical protein